MSDVRARSTEAAERNGGSGRLQDLEPGEPESWWVRELLTKGWLLLVTKSDGKLSVREVVAYVLLAVALTFGGASYWKSQGQHDEIIRLKTIVEIQSSTNADILSKVDQARNFASIADKNAARLEGKFDQFSIQYGIKNAGN